MGVLASMKRHPLVSYFVLVFVISWGALLAVILPTTGYPAPADAFDAQGAVFFASIFALLLGPPIAGLTMTAVVGGRPALRELRGRIARTRIPAGHYLLTLLAPGTFFAVLAVLSAFDPVYLPGLFAAPAGMVIAGIVYALGAGFFEELGWTGFATPRLIERYGTVRGALVLGVIWSLWHVLPVSAFTLSTYGAYYIGTFFQGLVFLTSFRIVMTVAYEWTGSVFLAMLLHFTLTFSSVLIAPVTSVEQAMIWNTLWPLSLAVAAVIAIRLAASRRAAAPQRFRSA